MSSSIYIGLIQTANSTNVDSNIHHHENLIRIAASKGANIICLQELFNTQYFCTSYDESFFDLAEAIPGDLTARISALSKELEVIIIAPFFEKRNHGIYHNSLVVFDTDGEILTVYRKQHIPDDPGFYEKYYFTPGDKDSGTGVVKTTYGSIGTLICWDQWFPEAARLAALRGAEILFYPTAIGVLENETEAQKQEFKSAWQTIQRAHAIANGCYVVAVNRVGEENGTRFWGGSFVCGPFGQIISEAGDEEEVLVVEIQPEEIKKHRLTWPFLRDRRIELYDGITKRTLTDE